VCPTGVLRFAELPPAEVKFSYANKYLLLVVGLVIAVIVGLPIFALVYPPAAMSRLLHGWVFGTPTWRQCLPVSSAARVGEHMGETWKSVRRMLSAYRRSMLGESIQGLPRQARSP